MTVISVSDLISSFSVWSTDNNDADQQLLCWNMQGTWGVRALRERFGNGKHYMWLTDERSNLVRWESGSEVVGRLKSKRICGLIHLKYLQGRVARCNKTVVVEEQETGKPLSSMNVCYIHWKWHFKMQLDELQTEDDYYMSLENILKEHNTIWCQLHTTETVTIKVVQWLLAENSLLKETKRDKRSVDPHSMCFTFQAHHVENLTYQ